jgi:hypothetical protein
VKNKFFSKFVIAFLLLPLCGASFSASAQKREHLTDAEIEIVREAQELDVRTKVFVKAAERRLIALGVLTETKPSKKEKDNFEWGEAPTGTRAELLADIAKILEEAMSNLDVVWSREAKNPLVPKALQILSEAAARFQPHINLLDGKVSSDKEREAVFQVKRDLGDILEAQKEFSASVKPTE